MAELAFQSVTSMPVAVPRARGASVDDSWRREAWRDACADVLEQLGVGVIACDESLHVLAANQHGARLLARFCMTGRLGPLPPSIAGAARDWLADQRPGLRERPVRLVSPDGSVAVRAGFASVAGSRAFLTVSLRRESLCDDLLREAMRTAWQVSARDVRLIMLVRQGCSNREIAEALGLTYGTVKVYVHALFERLDVHTRAELIAQVEALRSGA